MIAGTVSALVAITARSMRSGICSTWQKPADLNLGVFGIDGETAARIAAFQQIAKHQTADALQAVAGADDGDRFGCEQ